MPREGTKSLTAAILLEDFETLEKIASEEGMSLPELVRRAVSEYCQRQGYDTVDLSRTFSSWGGNRRGKPAESPE